MAIYYDKVRYVDEDGVLYTKEEIKKYEYETIKTDYYETGKNEHKIRTTTRVINIKRRKPEQLRLF